MPPGLSKRGRGGTTGSPTDSVTRVYGFWNSFPLEGRIDCVGGPAAQPAARV